MQRGPAAVCKTNDEKIKLEAEFASSFCVVKFLFSQLMRQFITAFQNVVSTSFIFLKKP